MLKSIAFRNRGLAKDAYDLFYVIRNYGNDVADVAERLKPLLANQIAQEAGETLRSEFRSTDSPGVARAASFAGRQQDDAFRQEIVGYVGRLLSVIDQ